ncbi:hypothetical protein FGO68_gene9553 [Halteria grandinella]|uniref:Uncharacterized protein n=1 Tax=Halteria grandinella TaxID=5974 RepID=A0A8J8T542_HALGN|nr:hypothetical protein FGO68_gene9553 [Halteria grandinella]
MRVNMKFIDIICLMFTIINSDKQMELITTERAVAKYRMGRIKSKYLIISIIVDILHGKESLAFLAKTSRIFRNIMLEVPHLIKKRLVKKLKPLITCRQYNNFGLTGWDNFVPSRSFAQSEAIESLFKFSKRELCVTADSMDSLRFLAHLAEKKQSCRVRCLTIPCDRPFSWINEEYHVLLKKISPNELNVHLNRNDRSGQEHLDFKDIIPSSVKAIRLDVSSDWRDANDLDPTQTVSVDFLYIRVEEPYQLRYLLKKIRPLKMLILALPQSYNKLLLNKIVKEDMLKGIPQLIITLSEKIEVSSPLLHAFEKIQVSKKYLLGKFFSHQSSLKAYLDFHQSRLVELFKETSVLSKYLGEDLKGISLYWCSIQRQLRDFMKLPYPCKEIEVNGKDKIYADYFNVNIVQERIQESPKDGRFIYPAKDPFTKFLTINSTYDFNGGVMYEIAYFLRKCTHLERFTLRINDIRLWNDNSACEFDVKAALLGTSSNIKKLDAKYFGQYLSHQSNLVEEQLFNILLNIVTNSKDVLDTLALDISSQTTFKRHNTLFEVSNSLIRILTPAQNKLTKVVLRADQLDNYLVDLLQNEHHFPCLKSVFIHCQNIERNSQVINLLIDLASQNKRPKRPIQKLGFSRMTSCFATNDRLKAKVFSMTHPAIQYLKLSKISVTMEDCEKILSGSNKPIGFALEVVKSNYSAEQIAYLAQKFPQCCLIL